jgi:hypothetical protein
MLGHFTAFSVTAELKFSRNFSLNILTSEAEADPLNIWSGIAHPNQNSWLSCSTVTWASRLALMINSPFLFLAID